MKETLVPSLSDSAILSLASVHTCARRLRRALERSLAMRWAAASSLPAPLAISTALSVPDIMFLYRPRT